MSDTLLETSAPEQSGQNEENNGNTEVPQWYYSAPTDDSEGVAGKGDVPDYFKVDKYKSLEDQAKAYGELEKRFGGFTGSPETYELPEGFDIPADDPLFASVAEIGKEANMSNETFTKLVEAYTNVMAQGEEQAKAQAMEALGKDADQRILNVQSWLNSNADKEMIEKIAPLATSAESIEALEWFIGKTKNSNVASNDVATPAPMTEAEYAQMLMAKDDNGNLKIATDKEYKKKMDAMTAQRMGA